MVEERDEAHCLLTMLLITVQVTTDLPVHYLSVYVAYLSVKCTWTLFVNDWRHSTASDASTTLCRQSQLSRSKVKGQRSRSRSYVNEILTTSGIHRNTYSHQLISISHQSCFFSVFFCLQPDTHTDNTTSSPWTVTLSWHDNYVCKWENPQTQ